MTIIKRFYLLLTLFCICLSSDATTTETGQKTPNEAVEIAGKLIFSEYGSRYRESKFILKQESIKELALRYDHRIVNWWKYTKKQKINKNIKHLALITDKEGFPKKYSAYHNCLFVKLKGPKRKNELTLCLKDDLFLEVYKSLIDTADANNRLDKSLAQHRQLYQFLTQHKKTYEFIWRGKTDATGDAYDTENALQMTRREELKLDEYRGTGTPDTIYKTIGEPYFIHTTPYLLEFYHGNRKPSNFAGDISIKQTAISKGQYMSGSKSGKMAVMLQKEALTMVGLSGSPYVLKPLDISVWFNRAKARQFNLSLAMDKQEETLEAYFLREDGGFETPFHEDKRIAEQLMKVVADFHEQKFFHFDIKPGNITIQKQNSFREPYLLKLINYQYSRLPVFYRLGKNRKNNLIPYYSKTIGSYGYIASCREGYDAEKELETPKTIKQMEKKDSYAVGITLISLLLGKHLEKPDWQMSDEGFSKCKMVDKFRKKVYPEYEEAMNLGINKLVKLLYWMTDPNFETRFTVKEALQEWKKPKKIK